MEKLLSISPDRCHKINDAADRSCVDLEKLLEINHSLVEIQDLDDLILHIISSVRPFIDAEAISIILPNETNKAFSFSWMDNIDRDQATKLKEIKFSCNQGIAGSVYSSGQAELIHDVENDPRHFKAVDYLLGFSTKSMIAAPLHGKEKTIGVLEIINKRIGTFDEKDFEFITATSALIGIALENALIRANLQRVNAGLMKSEGELKRHQQQLEKMVEERTAELKRSNDRLLKEIGERKRTEEALRESEEKHRLLIDNANDAIFITQDRTIKFPNPKTEEITGYSAEELPGIPLVNLIHPKDRDKIVDRNGRRLKEKKPPSTYSFRLINQAGKELWVGLNTVAIDWEGRPAVLNFLRDVTEQKKLEAQLRQAHKMEAVGTLAGGIAHDFNNLLQAISGYTQILLMEKEPSNPDYTRLEEIKNSVQRAADLTKQLLIFSRKVESKLKPVNLNQEVTTVSKLLERTIPKMISIESHLSEGLNVINADPGQLEQIIMNLGVNARDAMHDGGSLIFETENVVLDEEYCKIHPGANPGEYALLRVSDTGHGMDAETLGHIFEPFYTTKDAGRGTGLGLAMVYGIVKSHGGYITCQSILGQGTTFNIYFPVAKMKTEHREEVPRLKDKIPAGGGTILIVDDEKTILDIAKDLLERFGFTTITAKNGETAIEIFKRERDNIDLVILDVGMPGMGGHGCLEQLLKIDPKVKVLIASGYAAIGKVRETLESGAAGFIGKPFRLEDMLKRIGGVLNR